MKPFKVIVDPGFSHGHSFYEEGNTYKRHDLNDNELDAYHRAGFIHIDGLDDNETNPDKQIVVASDIKIKLFASEEN